VFESGVFVLILRSRCNTNIHLEELIGKLDEHSHKLNHPNTSKTAQISDDKKLFFPTKTASTLLRLLQRTGLSFEHVHIYGRYN